jgi:DNA-binding LacI/PurR family transcriptional regulator
VDSWAPDVALDCVIQDGYRGSMLAAEYLAGRGHRRIGWVGPALSACAPLELERFSGAAGALASAGIELTPDLRVGTPAKDYAGYVEGLMRMLSRPDRPTAVLAMWQTAAQAVAAVAGELGLEIGSDLDVVGWVTEQGYDAVHRPNFRAGAVPPAVTWSVADMAEAALARLVERRENPGMAPVHVRIPTRLRFADEQKDATGKEP